VLPVALGMALHVALDVRHEVRMNQARAAAMERDDFSCRACGTRASHVGTHLRRQPWLLPSYDAQNLVSLCAPCHAAAHARERGAGAWR
jgi:5-methylcytosine-specific restriction endonuclease McrA